MVEKQEKKRKINMSRSNWKGPYIHKSFTKKTRFHLREVWSRSTTIVPAFIGKTVQVHNGRVFISVKIISLMIGHKLGEFVPTRKSYNYKKHK